MANELTSNEQNGDEGPMSIPPNPSDGMTGREIMAAIAAIKPLLVLGLGQTAAYAKMIHDRKLWRDCGFATCEEFDVYIFGSKMKAHESLKELQTFGLDMLRAFEKAKLSHSMRRDLTHVDKKYMIEFKNQVLAEDDPKALKKFVDDFYNAHAQVEKEKDAAVDNARNWKRKAEALDITAKDLRSKLAKSEKQLADTKEYFGKSPTLGGLHRHALEAIAGFVRHVHRAGIATEDVKGFKRCFDELHDGLDELWRSFCDPPAGMQSREDFIRLLQKDKGFTKEEAEGIADEYKFTE